MITFEIRQTGIDYIEVSWDRNFGTLDTPVYGMLADAFQGMEEVRRAELLRFSAHLVCPTITPEVLESIKETILTHEELQEALAEELQVVILPP